MVIVKPKTSSQQIFNLFRLRKKKKNNFDFKYFIRNIKRNNRNLLKSSINYPQLKKNCSKKNLKILNRINNKTI